MPGVTPLFDDPSASIKVRPRRVVKDWARRAPYAFVVLLLAVLTLVLWNVGWSFDRVNMAMLYLLPVLYSAVQFGRGPAYLAAGLGVLLFDFFFVPPLLSFSVSDFRYLISFAVFLLVAGLTATQASRLRQQLRQAEEREARTASLYAISQHMVAERDVQRIGKVSVDQLAATLKTSAALFLPDAAGQLQVAEQTPERWIADRDVTLAQMVYKGDKIAGKGTDAFAQTDNVYLPLLTKTFTHGVLCVKMEETAGHLRTDQLEFLKAVAGLTAVSITRAKLEEEAKVAQLSAESERLRTALLDSLSHELRTPLASITGSVTGLLEHMELLDVADRTDLLQTIRDGARRMDRLIANLLGMVRLESGMIQLRRRLCDLSDIIGVCVRPFVETQSTHALVVHVPDDLPPIEVDDVLIEQVLVNVISNAFKYAEKGTDIVIEARLREASVEVAVMNQGIGVTEEERTRVFDKFYRSPRVAHIPGTGLGLAICRGIARAHGGDVEAVPTQPPYTEFVLRLPRNWGAAAACETGELDHV